MSVGVATAAADNKEYFSIASQQHLQRIVYDARMLLTAQAIALFSSGSSAVAQTLQTLVARIVLL